MPWYVIALAFALVVGPFDALYLYIKSEKRKQKKRDGK